MSTNTLIMLVLSIALVAGVSQFAITSKQKADMASNIQDWAVGVSSYVNEICQSGLVSQDDVTLASYLPLTFNNYGLSWDYEPLTEATTLRASVIPPLTPANISANRAMSLIVGVTGGQHDISGASPSATFSHQRIESGDYLGDVYVLPILAYHRQDGTCS